MLTGSHRGVLSLWDMRFHVPVKSWLHPSRSHIHRLWSHPATSANKGKRVLCAVGDNEVAMFDVERGRLREMFCGRPMSERPPLTEIQVGDGHV